MDTDGTSSAVHMNKVDKENDDKNMVSAGPDNKDKPPVFELLFSLVVPLVVSLVD